MESRPNNDDQARGLRKSLKEFKSVASLCMMVDFHSNFYEPMASQKEHVGLSSVQAMVVSTISQISALRPGLNVAFCMRRIKY